MHVQMVLRVRKVGASRPKPRWHVTRSYGCARSNSERKARLENTAANESTAIQSTSFQIVAFRRRPVYLCRGGPFRFRQSHVESHVAVWSVIAVTGEVDPRVTEAVGPRRLPATAQHLGLCHYIPLH